MEKRIEKGRNRERKERRERERREKFYFLSTIYGDQVVGFRWSTRRGLRVDIGNCKFRRGFA